jgi:ankyrin repeat protein
MRAAEKGHLEVVKFLVQAGADILKKNKVGEKRNLCLLLVLDLGLTGDLYYCWFSAR